MGEVGWPDMGGERPAQRAPHREPAGGSAGRRGAGARGRRGAGAQGGRAAGARERALCRPPRGGARSPARGAAAVSSPLAAAAARGAFSVASLTQPGTASRFQSPRGPRQPCCPRRACPALRSARYSPPVPPVAGGYVSLGRSPVDSKDYRTANTPRAPPTKLPWKKPASARTRGPSRVSSQAVPSSSPCTSPVLTH